MSDRLRRVHRRHVLTLLGVSAVGSLAGCAESQTNSQSTGDDADSNNDTSDSSIATSDPWRGTIFHFSSEPDSPEAIRAAFDADIPRLLISPTITTAFIATEDTDTIEAAAQDAGFDTHGLLSVSLDGGRVCDITNWIQFPAEPTESAVREAFPNAIYIVRNTASGEELWEIYTPQISRDELSSRLETLAIGSETSIVTYRSCNTGE